MQYINRQRCFTGQINYRAEQVQVVTNKNYYSILIKLIFSLIGGFLGKTILGQDQKNFLNFF